MNLTKPILISPEKFDDKRGTLYAYNNFNIENLGIKRTFSIKVENFRGWHGHQKENNWFKVTSGMLKILLVKPDSWDKPSFNIKPQEFVIKAEDHQIIFVPAGYVSAIKSLVEGSILQVFSNKTLEESLQDDYRFSSDRWYYDSFM
jgi:dTDP-4-dehydrorhamnose 3,5-epimerase-like enzyme